MSWTFRPGAREWRGPATTSEPAAFHAALPGYAPTPLVDIPALAAELRVGRVLVKDESSRLGLPAFKILGVSWAVHRFIARDNTPAALVTATDGNHGRALARVARQRGLPARIYVPDGVHPAAVAAIEAEGAAVTRVAGTYDDAVARAAADAAESGAALIQDTAWRGYTEIPGWIVEGYATLFTEIDTQLGATHPDLVVVPVGVGSLAQAAVAHYRRAGLTHAPAMLSVEPDTAACVLASLVRDEAVTIVTGATIMAGLNCGTPSELAWPVLRNGLDAAGAVTDAQAATAAHDLAQHGVAAGPCGAAALAAARSALADDQRRAQLGITETSIVVLLSTEGSAANPNQEPR
jgi:diaminopropionate ammonia-lyase